MKVMLTEKGYDHKPTSKEIAGMWFEEKEVSPSSLSLYITEGYAYTHIFGGYRISITDKTKENFLYSNAVCIDVDHSEFDLNDTLDQIVYKPTIAHYTPTYKNEDGTYRFRLIYMFEDDLNLSNYNSIYDRLCDSLNVQADVRAVNQYYNGCLNCDIVVDNKLVYTIGQFLSNPDTTPIRYNFNEWYIQYLNSIETALVPDEVDYRFELFPDDYCCIRRKWGRNADGKPVIRKWEDGDDRKKKLYRTAMVLKHNNKDATYEWLFWCLKYEYSHFYVHKDGVGDGYLKSIAKKVMDSTDAVMPSKHSIFRVSKSVPKKERRKLAASKRWELRRGWNDDDVLSCYDSSLSLRENVRAMKEVGIELSFRTLANVLKRNGCSGKKCATIT